MHGKASRLEKSKPNLLAQSRRISLTGIPSGAPSSMQRGSVSTTHQYDGTGNRTLLIDSDGGLTTYSYDGQYRLVGIVKPYGEVTTVQYDALDRESERTLANGMTVNHTYDSAGRETVLSALGLSGAALSRYTAAYDAVGNRLSVLELDGSEASYGYDPTDQLTNEPRTGANAYDTTYSYDPVGNRLTKDDGGQFTTYSFNSANELILTQPPTGQPTTSTYDANGNFLTENAGGALTTYSGDYENRLIGVSSPSGVESYSYSADGMRKEMANSAGTVYYVRDGENVLIETDADLVTQAHYTDFPGVWGGLTSERRGDVSSIYGFDQQANTRILASINGNVTDNYLYKAFGEELVVSGNTVNPLRFGGQVGYWRDEAERLDVRRRVLRVDQGRWMSRDPMGFWGGEVNLYGYVGNNPIMAVDPFGLQGIKGQFTGEKCWVYWYMLLVRRGASLQNACKVAVTICKWTPTNGCNHPPSVPSPPRGGVMPVFPYLPDCYRYFNHCTPTGSSETPMCDCCWDILDCLRDIGLIPSSTEKGRHCWNECMDNYSKKHMTNPGDLMTEFGKCILEGWEDVIKELLKEGLE